MTRRETIPFSRPAVTGKEADYVQGAILSASGISGGGRYTRACEQWFKDQLGCAGVLLTGSCTHALEMAALLLDLKPGDEIIMPSFTFVTTANAFVLHGGTPVFVDIDPRTMNIDDALIEAAITKRTRAIVAMHYAGVGCHMERVLDIAARHKLMVIEDAAQAVFSRYQGKPLGSFGALAAFSFHETKNYTSGEGGALIINDPSLLKRAEIIQHKGTNREAFFRGEVDKYSWVDIGSSYIMSELNAAYLCAQLEAAEEINRKRHAIWHNYHYALQPLAERGLLELPHLPDDCAHNAHLFFFKTRNPEERAALMAHLKAEGISATFHYVPLHSAPAGLKYARFHGRDRYTTRESERLIRLPLFYNMSMEDAQRVIESVKKFYNPNT